MRFKEYKNGGKAAGDRKTYAYNYLISKGVPSVQAAGIIGNLVAESAGLNTTIIGKADDKKSVGLAQWHSERKTGLYNFAKKQGTGWDSLETQLDYILHELNTTEKRAKKSLFSAKTPQEATLAFMNDYERPAEWAKKQSSKERVNEALQLSGLKPDPNYTYNSEDKSTQQSDPYQFREIKSTDYYAPQVSQNISSLDNTQETTNLAEDKAAEIKNRLDQKKAEKAFIEQMIKATQVAYVNPEDYQSKPIFEEPQEQMFQQGGISQFKKQPFQLKNEVYSVSRDATSIPNTKRDLSLMLAEYNNAKKDEQELRTTGQIKNPNSIQYKRNVRTQPDIKQDNISAEQRNAPLNPLQRPLIYLANPEKVLGDLGVPGMETSELDRQTINANKFNPYQSGTDRFLNNAKIGLGYVPEATVNTAMAAAFMPEGSGALGLINETLNPLAGIKTNTSNYFTNPTEKVTTSLKDNLKSFFTGRDIMKPSNLIPKEELDNIINRELNYIKSKEYITNRVKNTGEKIEDVEKEISQYEKYLDDAQINIDEGVSDGSYYRPSNTVRVGTKNKPVNYTKGVVQHEVGHLLSPIDLNEKAYKNFPVVNFEPKFSGGNKKYNMLPEEQQVRYNKIKTYMEDIYGKKRGSEFNDEDIKNLLGENDFESINYNPYYEDASNFIKDIKHSNPTNYKNLLKDALNKSWVVTPIAGATYLANQNNPEFQQGGISQFKKQPFQLKDERVTASKDNTRVSNYNDAKLFNTNVRNKTDKEIAQEREARIQASIEAQKTPYTKENWRQQLAAETAATGDKLRVSNSPNFFDDYINPAAMIGSMASGLGQAPLQAQQSDSALPYVTAIGMPLFMGAVGGLGAKTTGQFVNNMVNPLAGTGDLVNNLGNKYLPNAYKLNPKAFKTSTDKFYRQVDNTTYNEGIESGLIKGKQDVDMTRGEGIVNLNKAFGDDAYYNKGSLYYKNNKDLPYLFEAGLPEDRFIPKVNGRTRKFTTENTSVRVSREPIPINDPNITSYKKDWLQGYKQVEVPKTTQSFKSEINWGNWNKEIPENPQLMNEYNLIEETSKSNGSWMKNPDGSAFQGTPEQFVQQNSENFKKSFPEGHKTVFRGLPSDNPLLLEKQNFTGVFTGDKNLAKGYGKNLYELGLKNSENSLSFNANGDDWLDLKFANRDVIQQQKNIDFNKKYLENLIEKNDNPNQIAFTKNNIKKSETSINENIIASKNQNYKNLVNHFKNKSEINTDDIATYLENKKLDNIQINNVLDGEFGDINISNQVPGNYLKSLKNNNGMFDMTNPNIYKSIVPIAGATYLANQNNPEFQQGGQIPVSSQDVYDFKTEGKVIKDNNGYWNPDNWGKAVEISSNHITMEGVKEPLYVVPDVGQPKLLFPNQNHIFPNATRVTEYPIKARVKTKRFSK